MGASPNCPLYVFRKVSKEYEPMLLRQEISSYQGFTVTHQFTGGYFDLIFNQHESAFWQALVVFKFRVGKYRIAECHEARWEIIDSDGTTAKEPTITSCR